MYSYMHTFPRSVDDEWVEAEASPAENLRACPGHRPPESDHALTPSGGPPLPWRTIDNIYGTQKRAEGPIPFFGTRCRAQATHAPYEARVMYETTYSLAKRLDHPALEKGRAESRYRPISAAALWI